MAYEEPGQLTTEEHVQTVSSSGKPLAQRVIGIQAARSLYGRVTTGLDDEHIRRARIKGQIDGNAPYNEERLKELGMGYMTNVNFMEMRSILDTKAAAHYELFFEVPTLIQVRIAMPSEQLDREPHPDFERIIEEEFTRLLMGWRGFLVNMDKVRRESDAYGLGVMVWRDEYDWRPKAYGISNFKPDPMAELDLDKLPFFFLDDTMTAGELIRKLEDEKAAKAQGWNVRACRKLLKKIYIDGFQQTDDKFNVSTWEDLQQRIRNNDWTAQLMEFAPIYTQHLLLQEVDNGEVSHYIMAKLQDAEDEYIFKSPRRFKGMGNVLWWLPYNNGDGYLRSVRGLASSIEHHCDLSNRYLGRVFDAGFINASLILQPKSTVDMSRLQLIRMGVITIVPPELQAIQSSFTPQLGSLVQLRDLSSSIMKNNTGVFRQNPELFAERQPEKTARQVTEEVSKEARIEKANIAYDYDHIEHLYREIFRRVTNKEYVDFSTPMPGQEDARKFVQSCIARGVPSELLFQPGFFEVSVTRAIGLGSLGVKLDVTNQVLKARGLFDETGRVNATRDWLAARVGYQNIDRYLPIRNRDKIPSNEDSIAVLENNDFAEGSMVPVGSDQRHTLHFKRHAEPIMEILDGMEKEVGAMQQGQSDPRKAIMVLGMALPHMQRHLEFLSMDPTRADFVKGGMKLIKAGLKVLEFLKKQDARMQKEQQQQQQEQEQRLQNVEGQNLEAQTRLAEIQKEFQLEMEKQRSLNEARAYKTQEQMDINRNSAEAKLALLADKQTAELAMKARKQDAEIEMDLAAARFKKENE